MAKKYNVYISKETLTSDELNSYIENALETKKSRIQELKITGGHSSSNTYAMFIKQAGKYSETNKSPYVNYNRHIELNVKPSVAANDEFLTTIKSNLSEGQQSSFNNKFNNWVNLHEHDYAYSYISSNSGGGWPYYKQFTEYDE